MRTIVWRAWLWGLALLVAGPLCAAVPLAVPQLPMPRQLSVYDGLPSNRINALAEDRQGYLWIATRDGLARYDGVGYRVWRVGDGLRDNDIWTVFVDDRDRVWIGTRNAGLAMLDAARREFTHYDRAGYRDIGSNDVWSVTQTPDGDLWFGTADGGLHRLRGDGGIERFMPVEGDPRSLPSASVTWLRVDQGGRLWIGTHHGVARWTGDGFDRLLQDVKPNAAINTLVPDRDGNFWFGTSSSAYVYRGDSGRIEQVPWRDPVMGQPALSMLVQDRQGAHWLDTRSGLSLERAGTVYDVPLYSHTSRGLVRPSWSSALEDREGGLWFASYDAGLWHLPANWRNFTVLRRRLGDPESPANAFVYGVAPAHDGGLWLVGSGGVLDWLDPDSGRVQHRLSGVCGDLVPHSVREMRDRSVWIGCHGQVTRFVPETGEVRRWRHDDVRDPAPSGLVVQIAEEGDGSVWLGAMNALQLRAPDGRLLQRLEAGDGHGFGVATALQQIARGPDGALWLATNEGLLMWNAGARRFEPVAGGPEWQVFAFAATADDVVWAGGNGMLASYRWNGVELIAERTVDARRGMPTVAPGGISVDGLGVVWMTSPRGLIRYDPERERLRVYGVRDGLPSQEFSDYPFEPTARGYIGVGTADGLVLFHPHHVQAGDRLPALAIESVRVRRGEEAVELATDAPMVLRHDDRDLRVVARLLSFTDAHAHRYRYRLDGYDPEWVEVGSGGERLFPSLRHGSYVLEVQARTADEEWTPVQRLEFVVQEPWWRTPWAIVGWVACGLLLLALLAWQYRARLKRRHAWQLAEHKRELAEHASLAKTRFLATLGHEVRTPMTGVLGMSELLAATELGERQRGYVESIRRAGEHLLRLVNDALDLARIEADRLELEQEPFDLHALVRETAGFCAPLAGQRGLAFDCEIGEDVPRWLLGDAVRVRQVLLNLLGNAVKFTERGGVALRAAALRPEGVRLVVSDTGPGLNEEQKQRLFRRFEQAEGARTSARYGGSGLGLAISQELASAMGGRIDIDSAPGRGTAFIVDLPLPAAAPAPAPVAPADAGATTGGLTLLLVEDDDTVAGVMVGLLEAQGHRVVHVGHGLAALSESAGATFDAALLDLDLPGVDGLTLARLLRGQGFDAPMAAVTARADGDAELAARQAGFDAFLRKPVTGAMLAAVLADMIGDAAASD